MVGVSEQKASLPSTSSIFSMISIRMEMPIELMILVPVEIEQQVR
jgi:hypothetical protein